MRTFVFNHVRQVAIALRSLRFYLENATTEKDRNEISETLCVFLHQMTGKIKDLEPFMRDATWLKVEIDYENNGYAKKNCKCVDCNKECRGKRCAGCWREILKEIHGTPDHICKK